MGYIGHQTFLIQVLSQIHCYSIKVDYSKFFSQLIIYVTCVYYRVAVKVSFILSSAGQWTTEPSMAASGCGRRWAGSSSLTDRESLLQDPF